MVAMRNFTNVDWVTFAGCEGDARIGDIVVLSEDKKYEAVIVTDDTGIGIFFEDVNIGEHWCLDRRGGSHPKFNTMMAESFPDEVEIEFLYELGFEKYEWII